MSQTLVHHTQGCCSALRSALHLLLSSVRARNKKQRPFKCLLVSRSCCVQLPDLQRGRPRQEEVTALPERRSDMNFQHSSTKGRLICATTVIFFLIAVVSFAQTTSFSSFTPGNLVVSRSVYAGTASTVPVGQPLPPICPSTASC